jgi:hypothetical protein
MMKKKAQAQLEEIEDSDYSEEEADSMYFLLGDLCQVKNP